MYQRLRHAFREDEAVHVFVEADAVTSCCNITTDARHKDIESFGHLDGISITEPRFVIPLVIALRQTLMKIANARQMQNGQQTKMELVYAYLTGPKFRQRVEAIVEKFSDMQADLDRERKTMTRLWAKREAQIAAVIESTVGMYGDLQGIAGAAIQEIEGLELPMMKWFGKVRSSALSGRPSRNTARLSWARSGRVLLSASVRQHPTPGRGLAGAASSSAGARQTTVQGWSGKRGKVRLDEDEIDIPSAERACVTGFFARQPAWPRSGLSNACPLAAISASTIGAPSGCRSKS